MNRLRLPELGLTMGRWGVVGMAASMPISRAVFNLCAALMLVGWVLSGDWQGKWNQLRHDVVAWACLGLYATVLFSAVYSTADSTEVMSQLLVYSKLLYVPIIITLMADPPWHRKAWFALIAGLSVTLAALWLDVWIDIPGTRTYATGDTTDRGVFYHHIAQGMALAFLAAYALHRALMPGPLLRRGLWLLLGIADIAALLFISDTRAGQLSVLAALFLVALTHAPVRWRWASLAISTGVIVALILSASPMQHRFKIAWQEVSTFQSDGESTSVGARIQAWVAAKKQIEQAPLLGHGAGSYRGMTYQHFKGSPICALGVCEQPHNQFIMTLFETGLLGLLALLAFLAAPLLSPRHPRSEAALLYLPFLGIFVATAFFDSSLVIRPQAYFVVTTLGLLMASRGASSPDHPPQMR